MKIILLTIPTLIVAISAACSASGDIKINIEKKTSAFTATYGVIQTQEKSTTRGRDSVTYSFYLSNFDMHVADRKTADLGPELTTPEQKKIFFFVTAIDLDQGFGTKLREGVYSNSQAKSTERTPGLELGSFRVYTFHDGEEDQWARLGGTEESWVNIVTIKGDTVEGEIHFLDGDDKVEGKFTAKMTKGG